jgi:hypothetical protein
LKEIEKFDSCLFLILFHYNLLTSLPFSFLVFHFSFFIFRFSFFVSYFFHFFSDLTAEEDFEFKEKCDTYESVLTLAGSVVSDILPVSERDILMSVGVTEEDMTERDGEGEECALARWCSCLCLFVSFVVFSISTIKFDISHRSSFPLS